MKAPFTGDVFTTMFNEDVDVVAHAITSRNKALTYTTYRLTVYKIMCAYLDALQQNTIGVYHGGNPSTAGDIETRISGVTGIGQTTVGTVLGEIEIQAYYGKISIMWFDPARVQQTYAQAKSDVLALQPSFATKLALTILKPLGITPESIASIGKWVILVLALVAIIYVAKVLK